MFKQAAIFTAMVLAIGILIGLIWNRRFLVGLWHHGGQARDGTLQVGESAPNAPVVQLDGREPRMLREWFGTRPVVLVFGSFT